MSDFGQQANGPVASPGPFIGPPSLPHVVPYVSSQATPGKQLPPGMHLGQWNVFRNGVRPGQSARTTGLETTSILARAVYVSIPIPCSRRPQGMSMCLSPPSHKRAPHKFRSRPRSPSQSSCSLPRRFKFSRSFYRLSVLRLSSSSQHAGQCETDTAGA
ncbi:hypothetical protein P175DRAFT_0527641 [Aspergillus ochraceoroseus IBT 24754]|uniref:Uncharacterized protein n=1 Tax=Aspergillus ochraceoroseus IBT 24754 TaxID=1392256 RepID=A0A2T5M6M6_9EURO|nr:uncharacterized protein P175DRAFT_0527641 [Aspergillus ochraceoroseus IBT 24754]PTU24188.1 hypothetical protein P175DRAFT_0527641 [Aspergillus ochraceoroseus IBT 24754]